jgi:hypothetical protein
LPLLCCFRNSACFITVVTAVLPTFTHRRSPQSV